MKRIKYVFVILLLLFVFCGCTKDPYKGVYKLQGYYYDGDTNLTPASTRGAEGTQIEIDGNVFKLTLKYSSGEYYYEGNITEISVQESTETKNVKYVSFIQEGQSMALGSLYPDEGVVIYVPSDGENTVWFFKK